jgi:hypothetical protein
VGAAAPNVSHAYFPTDAGVEWVYNETIHTSFSSFTTSKGATAHSLNYPNGGKEYFVTSADQISLQGLFLHSITVGDGVVYTGDVQFDSPLPILRDSWTPSYTQEVSGKGSIDVSPTYGKQSLTYSGTVAYIGDDDLSTSLAGFNTKSLMIRLTLSVTVQGQTFKIPYEVDLEIAEGVGIVRRKQGDVTYDISSMTGFDTDRDGVYGAADQYPDNVGMWEAGPLYASDDGIAFTSLPSYSRLTQTVTIMAGNRAAPVEWSASSDQSWLSVSPLSDGELKLTADPAGLAADALYYATVSVAQSAGTNQHAPASIRVALWVGSQDAVAAATLPITPSKVTADPLRPYFYVNNGSSIDIYDIYTQALVDSIPATLDGHEQLRVSTDGSFLFAGAKALHRIALDAPYAQSSSKDVIAGVTDFAYARPQGHPILFDGRGHIFDGVTLKTIDRLWIQGREFDGHPVASVLGNRACVGANGYFVFDPILSCFELAYVSAGDGDIRFKRTGTRELSYRYRDFALRDDGEYAYLLHEASAMVEVYETWRAGSPTYLSSTGIIPAEVEVDADGIVYSGSGVMVGVDSSNINVSNLTSTGRDVRVSGDGAVMLGVDGGGLRLTRTY